jgi:alginate O-acetyltransferase complex protein AlgJ
MIAHPTRRAVLAAAASAALLPRARAATIGSVIVGTNGWLFPAWETLSQVDLAAVDQVAPIVAGVVHQFKAGGIDVAVTLMPIRARIYRRYYPADAPFTAELQQRYTHGSDRLAALGVLAPDLATLFAARAALPAAAVDPDSGPGTDPDFVPVGADLFFKADTHWTPNASIPAARELARQVTRRFSLPASATPGAQLGDPVKSLQEKNDLADLLPAALQRQYRLQSYLAPQVASAQGDDALIAADSADTVVIGNSYMQPKYGFTAQLSNALNRPVSLFWKIDRYGPFATLTEYLASDLFKSQRPRLIVWNLRESQLEHLPDDDDFYAQNAMSAAALTAAIKTALA